MTKIALLMDYPEAIPDLTNIWYEVLGKIWLPDVSKRAVSARLNEHLNESILPIGLVALENGKAVGMCCLRKNDGIRDDLTPWLGSLVVHPDYQNQGIGKMLINAIKEKAKSMGFKELYLFAFDKTVPDYYERLGWKRLGEDKFRRHPVTVMSIKLKKKFEQIET